MNWKKGTRGVDKVNVLRELLIRAWELTKLLFHLSYLMFLFLVVMTLLSKTSAWQSFFSYDWLRVDEIREGYDMRGFGG